MTDSRYSLEIAMTNALQALDAFKERFDNPQGARLGLYGAATNLGGTFTIFVTPWIMQKFGRRVTVAVGCLGVIGSALIQTFATNFSMFVAGKVLLGFFCTIVQIAGPVLVTELAYPTQRSRITSLYNTVIYIGFIMGAWIAYGTRVIPGNLSWQLPCALQAVLPTYQLFAIWLCPESPRWLFSVGQEEKARQILIKYHGGGVETPLVRAEIDEIRAGIEADASQMKFNYKDVKDLLSHKGNQRRLICATITAVGSQACGSGLISAYLPQVLNNVGMTTMKEQTLIAGIVNIWSWVVGVLVAVFINRLNKRSLFLTGTAGMIVAFIVWTAMAARYEMEGKDSYGISVVAMIFVYNFFYGRLRIYLSSDGSITNVSQVYVTNQPLLFLDNLVLEYIIDLAVTNFMDQISYLPLTVAYPLELCTTKQRSLFFSWTLFSISLSCFIVNYINPIGIQNLQWRYYILTIVFTCVVWVLIYFTFVETRGLSLEEVAISQ